MDPLSVLAMVIAVGKAIPPLIECLRKVQDYRGTEQRISDALKQTISYCELLEILMKDFESINNRVIPRGHTEYLGRTLNELNAVVMSHRREVKYWLDQLGIPSLADLESNEGRNTTQSSASAETEFSGKTARIRRQAGRYLRVQRLVKIVTRLCLKIRTKCFIVPAPEPESISRTAKLIEESSEGLTLVGASRAVGKLKYVVFGESNVKKMSQSMESWASLLSTTLTCMLGFKIISAGSTGPSANAQLQITHPTPRFVVEARKRFEQPLDVLQISESDWDKYYNNCQDLHYIDKHAVNTGQYQLFHGDAIPRTFDDETPSPPGQESARPDFRNCIFVDRGRWTESTEQDSLRLARMFAAEKYDPLQLSNRLLRPREDGDMLRCTAAIKAYGSLMLVFKLPSGSSKEIKTLRSILVDSGENDTPKPNVVDRAKLALRLATAVLVVHSLGLVHKRINPETIILVESTAAPTAQQNPPKLGYPYLVAFQTIRGDFEPTECIEHQDDIRRRAIYYQPRYREDRINDRYRMLDDIFALGVCLYEIGMWRSLFVFGGKDYERNTPLIKLSKECGVWEDMGSSQKVEGRIKELIRVVGENLPGFMGPIYTKAVIACLAAGTESSPFAEHPALTKGSEVSASGVNTIDRISTSEDTTEPVSVSYLKLVLQNLQSAHKVWEGEE